MNWAIRADDLGKRYRIRSTSNALPYRTLRDDISRVATAPFRALRGSRNQTEDFWALKNVSFELNEGDVLGIIGHNGAGKSTLLKLLSQITRPTTGTAQLRGRVGSLLEVGTGFHPELTGRENIFLSGAVLGMTRREVIKRFDEIVEFAEITKFLDVPAKRYSSGMYVRLAFSVAAHLTTDILLIDEVLAVGDVDFQRKCIGKMESESYAGRSVLLVSHSMSTVKSLCNRAMLLKKGTIAASGAVADVVADYLGSNEHDPATKPINPLDYYPIGSRAISLDYVTLRNAKGSAFSVSWREPIRLTLAISVRESLRDVAMGAGIRSLDGTKIYTVHHDDGQSHPLWAFEPGQYTIDVTLPNDLSPGFYKLHVGADHQHLRLKNIFAIDPVILEVLEHSDKGICPLASNEGVIHVDSTWECPVYRASVNAGNNDAS